MEYVLELQRLMVRNNYLISIRDNFETLLAKSVLKITDTRIKEENIDKQIKNRVFSVIVECVQNVCSKDSKDLLNKDSVLLMNKVENGYQILAGTGVDQNRRDRLTDLLEDLESKSIDAIKKDRLKILSDRSTLTQEMQDQLTFMELFVRSNRGINFFFDETEEGIFFMIKIDITI